MIVLVETLIVRATPLTWSKSVIVPLFSLKRASVPLKPVILHPLPSNIAPSAILIPPTSIPVKSIFAVKTILPVMFVIFFKSSAEFISITSDADVDVLLVNPKVAG